MMYYAELSDEQIQALAAKGDRAAEEALTGRYVALVETRARSFFLVGADKKDLIQEGMIGLITAVRRFSPEFGVPFRGFAEHCIRMRLLSAVKSASRLKHLPLNESVSFEQLSEDPDAICSVFPEVLWRNPEELVLARESKEELYGVFSRTLSRMEYQVLQLHLEGFSYREIANRLGKSEKSIDNAVQRIRRKLARNPN